jgi:hypothetical protein
MVEILNFKMGATIIKLNVAVTNLNVRGILMSHCGRDKSMENIPLNWLSERWILKTYTTKYDFVWKLHNSLFCV